MKRRWVVAGLALIAALLVGSTLLYRVSYGTWWSAPERISYCGRTCAESIAGLSLADVRERESATALPGDEPYRVVAVGKAPPIIGGRVLAALTPKAQRDKLGVSCTMGVYLQTGDDSYTYYGILGGP